MRESTQDQVYLGLVGRWNNDYGQFCAVKHMELQEEGKSAINYVCCATSKGVVIYNNIGRQTAASFIPLDRCEDLEIYRETHGGAIYLYIAGERGLHIINIDDSTKPYYVARCNTPGEAQGVAVGNNLAYVADGESGIQVVDISDPSRPRIVGSFDTPGFAKDVALRDDYAYVADGKSGFHVVDISDPSGPKLVGTCDTPGSAEDVVIDSNYAYVADGSCPDFGMRGGLFHVIDVSNEKEPFIFDTCLFKAAIESRYAQSVAISEGYAYVAVSLIPEGMVYIIDISDPNASIVGIWNTEGPAFGVDVGGNYAYVADGIPEMNGLQVLDISDPTGPKLVKTYYAYDCALKVDVDGDYAYVHDNYKGLQVIDISDKSGLKLVGGLGISDYAQDAVIGDDHTYIANGSGGLLIINTADSTGPKLVGTCDTPGSAQNVVIRDNYAYVADGENSLLIIHMSDPDGPWQGWSFNPPDNAIDVAIRDDYAYVADGESGLRIIDISDPTRAKPVSTFDTHGYAQGVVIGSNYAYVADGENGLLIIDISDPKWPWEAGKYDISDSDNPLAMTMDVALSGDYAFVAGGGWHGSQGNGLQVINVSDPYRPMLVGTCDTGSAYDVAIEGDYVYVAAEDYGLFKLKINTGPSPKGNLVLVAGGGENALWPVTQGQANQVLNTFFNHGYEFYDTWYLNPISSQDIDNDGVFDQLAVDDFKPTRDGLKLAVTDWGINESINTGPLFISLIGQGAQDLFQIMPNEVLSARELKSFIDIFQVTTRPVIVLLEFTSSGSFCNDLIDADIPPYTRTIITCTDEGSSYLDSTGQRSFTGQLLSLFQNPNQTTDQLSGLFADIGISHYQRVKLMQGLFSQARDSFWSSGHPFDTQPPQMVTAQGPHTLYSIALTADSHQSTITDPNQFILTDSGQTIVLTATGHYLDGDFDLTGQVYYHSSDPSILLVTPDGKASPNLATEYNGKAYILATIIDPNFTQAPGHDIDPNFTQAPGQGPDYGHDQGPDYGHGQDPKIPPLGGVTGRIPVTVEIPAWKEKDGLPLAIIVAGEISKNDSLWKDTHTIAQYAYLTLLDRGYSRSRIQYFTHLEEKLGTSSDYKSTDLDQDGDPDNDIDGIPSLDTLGQALTTWVEEKGTDSLILILVDHGQRSGGFYLNQYDILTPQLLDLWLDELQDQNPNLKITIIIESCYSGLFTEPLKRKDRIIVTSTNQDVSYSSAQGLVSFTYYLLTSLQAGSNLASAYDSARCSMSEIGRFLYKNKETLDEPRQLPQLENRPLANVTSLSGDFIISQGQPVITSVELSPDPDHIPYEQEVTIRINAFDLDGIAEVWAMVNATYSRPVFSGDPERPVIDLPRIDLSPAKEGGYKGTYSGFAYPGPYSLLVFARDQDGSVSLPCTVSLNVTGQAQNRALLLAGWNPADPDRFSRLLSHAQWVLQEKRLDKVVPLLPAPDGSGPTLENVHRTLQDLAQGADQLFVYLIGLTLRPDGPTLRPDGPTLRQSDHVVFQLNEQETLSPDKLDEWLDELSGCSQVVLVDTPEAQDFFRSSPNRIYVGGASKGEDAYLDQGAYCSFSHFFFTCLYWGASVRQAYEFSINALKRYSRQTPALEDGQQGKAALATYIGSPFVVKTCGPRLIVPHGQFVQGDESLRVDVSESDPNTRSTRVWALIKAPGKEIGELEEITFSKAPGQEGRYQASYSFVQAGTYEITVYTEDSHGLLDYDTTTVTVESIVKSIYEKDNFEVDDTPVQAAPILINDIQFPQLHSFHNAHDTDWVIFHAYPDRWYDFWVMRKGDWLDCPLKAALYFLDLDSEQIIEVLDEYDQTPRILGFSGYSGCEQSDYIYPGLLSRAGFYFLKFYYGCDTIPEGANTEYEIIKITDDQAAPTGTICGHVLHSTYHSGIPGVTVKTEIIAAGGKTQPIETKSGKGGVFFLFDLEAGDYQVKAAAPGYQDSLTTFVPVTENSYTGFTIYLSPDSQDSVKPSVPDILNVLDNYTPSVQASYKDRQKERIITLRTGMNLFSCPCLPLYADSGSFLQEIRHSVSTYYQKKDTPFGLLADIRRYDSYNGRWQTCSLDTNRKVQGKIFNLDPREGYLVYLDIRDIQNPDRSLKSLTLPVTCAKTESQSTESQSEGYHFKPGINFVGFDQSSCQYDSNRLLQNLKQVNTTANTAKNLANTVKIPANTAIDPANTAKIPATMFHYSPRSGSFQPHYQMFGQPAGQPCQLEEDKGYNLFIKEEIRDWQIE
ncbi:MAG: C13 family peptidase [bacterium]